MPVSHFDVTPVTSVGRFPSSHYSLAGHGSIFFDNYRPSCVFVSTRLRPSSAAVSFNSIRPQSWELDEKVDLFFLCWWLTALRMQDPGSSNNLTRPSCAVELSAAVMANRHVRFRESAARRAVGSLGAGGHCCCWGANYADPKVDGR